MFIWRHEHFLDINFPLQKVWDYCIEPTNWPKLNERFETCYFEGELKEGTTVKVKIKTRFPNVYVAVYVKTLKPYECTIVMKVPPFIQEDHSILHEISPTKTRISMITSVKSILTPFMRSYFRKKFERAKSKEFKNALEVIEKDLSLMSEK